MFLLSAGSQIGAPGVTGWTWREWFSSGALFLSLVTVLYTVYIKPRSEARQRRQDKLDTFKSDSEVLIHQQIALLGRMRAVPEASKCELEEMIAEERILDVELARTTARYKRLLNPNLPQDVAQLREIAEWTDLVRRSHLEEGDDAIRKLKGLTSRPENPLGD